MFENFELEWTEILENDSLYLEYFDRMHSNEPPILIYFSFNIFRKYAWEQAI